MLGSLAQGGEIGASSSQGPPTRDELDTPVLSLPLAFAREQHSRLARARQMSTAAWLTVETVDVDDAQSAFTVNFFANALRGEFVGGSVAHRNGTVVEDNFVHATFGLFE